MLIAINFMLIAMTKLIRKTNTTSSEAILMALSSRLKIDRYGVYG
jgi:hypothetical protein